MKMGEEREEEVSEVLSFCARPPHFPNTAAFFGELPTLLPPLSPGLHPYSPLTMTSFQPSPRLALPRPMVMLSEGKRRRLGHSFISSSRSLLLAVSHPDHSICGADLDSPVTSRSLNRIIRLTIRARGRY